MNWVRSEKGSGRLGCLVVLMLSGVFVYACAQVAPVLLSKVEFEENVSRLLSQAGAKGHKTHFVTKQINQLADLHGFEIEPDTLKVKRKNPYGRAPEIQVRLTYYRDVEFPGYTHRFAYRFKGTSFVGAF